MADPVDPTRTLRVLSLLLAPSLLAGCASTNQLAQESEAVTQPRSVSAREYGFVKPAVDVTILERESSGVSFWSRLSSGGDLWNRVRSGMQLAALNRPEIETQITQLQRSPRHLERLSEHAAPYLRLIVDEIDRRNLPMELALLPQVESRFNPKATSPVAAAGIWQFMPQTGREMGLRQDRWYDERRDVVASTRAALDYLEQLNKRFDGDWMLTMAAYNCGPGCVESARKANRSRGQPTDFWSLRLPKETRHYVPRILANAQLVAAPQRYGLRLPSLPDRPQLDVVRISEAVDLARLAKASGLDLDTLRELNPGLKQGRTTSGSQTRLLVPAGSGARLSKALRQAAATSS